MKNMSKFFWTLVCLFVSLALTAQDGDGKIRVEISKDVNGQKKTFKGEYNSTEEMMADPNYQEFAGESQGFNFWFGDAGDQAFDMDFFRNGGSSFFKFFGDDEGSNQGSFFFHDFDDDSLSGFFDMHFDDEHGERMKELSERMEEMFKRFHDGDHSRSVTIWKKVEVKDDVDEFGKEAKVDAGKLLKLDDLTFDPNPSSNGRLRLKFTAPDEGELSIKVMNLDGKTVFSRYFESFSGYYTDTIDLGRQKEGIYLLEIAQEDKRLTKKIVIN